MYKLKRSITCFFKKKKDLNLVLNISTVTESLILSGIEFQSVAAT